MAPPECPLSPQLLQLKVTPRAKANAIKQSTAPDGTLLYRVSVTVPPEDGKANVAVIRLLAQEFGLPQSAFTLIRGARGRLKTILCTPPRLS